MNKEVKTFNPFETLYESIVSGKNDDEVELVTECCAAHYDEPYSFDGIEHARCNACGEMATIINLAEEE